MTPHSMDIVRQSGKQPSVFQEGSLKFRVITIFSLIFVATVMVWLWTFVALGAYPLLLGSAFLAYTFGLRHAVDADHIAAIDNVTRKLMNDGKRPLTIGLAFSLGHSTVVIGASAAIAVTAFSLRDRFEAFHAIGAVIGTLVSSCFLFAIAAINLLVLRDVWRRYRRLQAGDAGAAQSDIRPGGLYSRVFRPLIGMVRHSWQMYPIGVLFGLGFDTATEIGLLGISAAQAAKGLPLWSTLVFPALFTAGMTLVDTTDGVLMLGAYGWAMVKPVRKLYYNMSITLISAAVALAVGGIEALGLLADEWHLDGPAWDVIGSLNEHFGTLGYLIIGAVMVCWIGSILFHRRRGADDDGFNAGT